MTPPWGQLRYGATGRPTSDLPPGRWYADYVAGRDARSHRILWYDIGGSIESAREADVMFFGDSRTLFAIPPGIARPFFEERGLRWFHMGFAHGEHYAFALSLLRRHNLQPRVAVVDAGRFFEPGGTPIAQVLALETGVWAATRAAFETRAEYAFEALVRPIFPHLLPMLFDQGSRQGLLDLFRSADDGSWLVRRYREETFPLRLQQEASDTSPIPLGAHRFKAHLDVYGGQLILTHIPSDMRDRKRAEQLAHELGVPFIAPRPADLRTADRVHSANRLATELLEALHGSGLLPQSDPAPSLDRRAALPPTTARQTPSTPKPRSGSAGKAAPWKAPRK